MVQKPGPGRPRHDDVLTPTEWRIVDAVRHGMTNREIAARRGVSVDAVKYHVANAVGKLGLESRQALRHWRGLPKGSYWANREALMDSDMEIVGVGQVARSVADVAETEAWYRDVLGLKHLFTFGKLAFFDCGGTRLMLSQGEKLAPAESILYFRVPDITACYSRLERAGVDVISAPHMIHKHSDGTEEWMAFFNDLEGRPLAIMSQIPPGGEGADEI